MRDFSVEELTSAGEYLRCFTCGFSSREDFLFRQDVDTEETVCDYGYGCDNDEPVTGQDLFDAFKGQRDGALERGAS